jgi:hypothetical protein
MPQWADDALSLPTRILGNSQSAVVFFTDTPELFGAEILACAAVDFRDGKIVRWVDYWDSRHFGVDLAAPMRMPPERFPSSFGEHAIGEHASPVLKDVVQGLTEALSVGDVAGAVRNFAPDVIWEDMALRTQLIGRIAVTRYLNSAVSALPYGVHSTVRHVTGDKLGGGYEWIGSGATRGIVALELDGSRRISRLTSVWDGFLLSPDDLRSLALASLD